MVSSFEKLQEALSELTFEVKAPPVQNQIEIEAYSIEEGLAQAAKTLDDAGREYQ
jgi:hypothetical protein